MHYAGVGSRKAPVEMLQIAELAASRLDELGWTLRSGHAPGMDQAFEGGAGYNAEIFLPWPTFERGVAIQADVIFDRPTAEAMQLASSVHPAWASLSEGARALHARNMHQVLGRELDRPVAFVLCWTPGGRGKGGTGQALRLARRRSIPVFDLGNASALDRIEIWLGSK